MDKILKAVPPTKKITIKKHAQQFAKEVDTTSENYSALKSIWSNLETLTEDTTEKIRQEVDGIREKQAQLETTVKMAEESRHSSYENVCRQKFDYFPFLEAIIRKAYKRGLLDEIDESEVEVEKPKASKKQKTSKGTTKAKAK